MHEVVLSRVENEEKSLACAGLGSKREDRGGGQLQRHSNQRAHLVAAAHHWAPFLQVGEQR